MPAPDARHPARCIFMHAAYTLWSGLDLHGVSKSLFSLLRMGLCEILHPTFREFLFPDVG